MPERYWTGPRLLENIDMQAQFDQWEQIFRSMGYVLPEPAPLVIQFAGMVNGLSQSAEGKRV